ncbi:uncharacterized protein LOC130692137 [Daphnia carinata]|uniref:uncharacterized protein LOC130692137 n=1 Tax=Daphnia carinata TaxID=120202 RepID=UPI00257EFE29|nr:uncharacterized protein LOC130692137 [Daphnia carinata]
MQFFVCLLAVSIATVANAQYQPYYDDLLYPYAGAPIPGIQPVIDQDRFLFQVTSWFTTTTTSTTTTTTTCTVSNAANAAACVAGRRRRGFLDDEEDIEPSPVNKVEPTQLPDMQASMIRKERKPDPQIAYWRASADYTPYEVQSTFGQRPFPVAYNPFFRRPVVAADPRLFVQLQVTRTSTTTVTTTSRSTPVCSSPSNFNQC